MRIEDMTEKELRVLRDEILRALGEDPRKMEEFSEPKLELEPMDDGVWHRNPMKHRGARSI